MPGCPGLVIAGERSGAGKTTLALGLVAALARRGIAPAPFKVGPDFIDAGLLGRVAGRVCRNLDTWMLSPATVRAVYARGARDAGAAMIEGVMGLFDGASPVSGQGSTAEVASLLGLPIVLVVDGSRIARSVAALACGYRDFEPGLALAGVVASRVGGAAHARLLAAALEGVGIRLLGWLAEEPALAIPERHLGLLPAAEASRLADVAVLAASRLGENGTLDALLAAARPAAVELPAAADWCELVGLPRGASRPVVAVARDEAFHFHYPENLELLEELGAGLAFFSPLDDPELPDGAAAVVLAGGFPEVFAARLAANRRMAKSLARAAARGVRIYAECGGLMALCQSLVDHAGAEHRMFGLLPGRTVMTEALVDFGYREVEALPGCPWVPAGATIRGHSFHHSRWEGPEPAARPYRSRGAAGGEWKPEGLTGGGKVLGSYVHAHFLSGPAWARAIAGV